MLSVWNFSLQFQFAILACNFSMQFQLEISVSMCFQLPMGEVRPQGWNSYQEQQHVWESWFFLKLYSLLCVLPFTCFVWLYIICIFCSLSYVKWCDELYRLLHISYVRNSTCRLLQLSQVKHLKETWMHQIGIRKPYVQTANLIMYLEFATFLMGCFLISHWTNKSYSKVTWFHWCDISILKLLDFYDVMPKTHDSVISQF